MSRPIRVGRRELELVKSAADRMSRRTNSRIEIDESRLEVTEDDQDREGPARVTKERALET